MLILGGIITLILLIHIAPRNGSVYNKSNLLPASVTSVFDDNNYQQGANLDFGNYDRTFNYQNSTSNSQPQGNTTTTYTYTTYPSGVDNQYQTYNNDYLYPNNYYNYNQYSPQMNPSYDLNYPGGCNPGYRYSIITGEFCRGIY